MNIHDIGRSQFVVPLYISFFDTNNNKSPIETNSGYPKYGIPNAVIIFPKIEPPQKIINIPNVILDTNKSKNKKAMKFKKNPLSPEGKTMI